MRWKIIFSIRIENMTGQFEPCVQLYVPGFGRAIFYPHICNSLRVYRDVKLIVRVQDKKQAGDILYT